MEIDPFQCCAGLCGSIRITPSKHSLQRLFSTFATGFPGIGLLILRLAAGIPLICFAIQGLAAATPDEPLRAILDVIRGLAGILLTFGLWTPIAGAGVAAAEGWIFLSGPFAPQAHPVLHIYSAVLGIALAMLGPGAWSVDARLFGRKLYVDRRPASKRDED